VWYKKDNGQILWKAVPKDKYDESIHGFKVLSFQENLANMNKMVSVISKFVPGARMVFTLSPIPLRATFRPVSCITANSASKAILRAAVDTLLSMHSNVTGYQFPSYL
jgi:hypothetical protein